MSDCELYNEYYREIVDEVAHMHRVCGKWKGMRLDKVDYYKRDNLMRFVVGKSVILSWIIKKKLESFNWI